MAEIVGCPRCNYRFWTDQGKTKPDPQAKDGKILKLVSEQLGGNCWVGSYKNIARTIDLKFQAIEAEIEGLWDNDKTDEARFRTLERKVEALGSDLCRHMYPPITQPQPKGGVARDKDGHVLIPGRSVVVVNSPEGADWKEWQFLYAGKERSSFVGFEFFNGTIARTPCHPVIDYCTWLFDLPSCGDEGTIPPSLQAEGGTQ